MACILYPIVLYRNLNFRQASSQELLKATVVRVNTPLHYRIQLLLAIVHVTKLYLLTYSAVLAFSPGPGQSHELHSSSAEIWNRVAKGTKIRHLSRGVVVNFDLGERFPRPRSQQRGSLRPRTRRVAVLRVGMGGGRPRPAEGVRGVSPGNFWYHIPHWGQFGPENKLIEGQPNEYDVICRKASMLAFHLWPTIFAGTPFRLQNICRNGVPPLSLPAPLHPCT